MLVPYGSQYSDLVGFLQRLGAAAKEAAPQQVPPDDPTA